MEDQHTRFTLERDDAAAARSAERQMRQAVDYSLDGIIVSSLSKCLYVNTACAHMQGYASVEELIASGRTKLSDGVHPDDLPLVMEEVRKRISGEKKISQYEVRLMRRDGTYLWVEARAALVRWSGEFASLSWFSDISRRKADEASLIEHRDAAERANRAKSEFLANMSHELRTPLNAIVGFSEMIAQKMLGPVSTRYVEYATDIHNSGLYLLELINGVLDLSKLDAGKLELDESDLDIRQLVGDCIRVIRPSASSAKIALVDEVPLGLPLLRADPRALKQVLLNFLSNAVKFTHDGGTVTIRAECVHNELRLRVNDTGIGMNQADIEVALEPFGQVRNDPLVAREHKGTGLGLPISLQLMKLHGGDITINSKPNVGTTITAHLPASRFVAAAAEQVA
jgi:PAS domain S-box-containing protein